MRESEILTGKKILIVDDEPDILGTLKELLSMCLVETASNFQTAREMLEEYTYDIIILDIMGVRGYDLLKIAHKKGTPALMLTAHAISPDDLIKSIKNGAHCYVPKEKIYDIPFFLVEILVNQQKRSKTLGKWFAKLKPVFDKIFGSDWLEKDKEFWEDFKKKYMDTDTFPY
jgi:DNA-binding NtrC family response regulator